MVVVFIDWMIVGVAVGWVLGWAAAGLRVQILTSCKWLTVPPRGGGSVFDIATYWYVISIFGPLLVDEARQRATNKGTLKVSQPFDMSGKSVHRCMLLLILQHVYVGI